MKAYQTYLFDLDGTLISTIELIYNCFKFSLKKYLGRKFSRKEILLQIGLPLKQQFAHFIKSDGKSPDKFDLDKISKDHMDYQLQIWKKYLRTYDSALETISTLKREGKKLGIVTSRLNATTNIYLEHTGLAPYIDCVITPESTQNHKPHPEPALTALKHLRGDPSYSVMVGDSLFDIKCGRAAGLDTVWVVHNDSAWGQIRKKKLDELEPGLIATTIITHLKELLPNPNISSHF